MLKVVLRQNSMRTENSAIPCSDSCLIQVIPSPSNAKNQQRVLETELPLFSGFWLAGHQDQALRQQLLKHRAMQLPRPMLIGVGQGGARRSRTSGPRAWKP